MAYAYKKCGLINGEAMHNFSISLIIPIHRGQPRRIWSTSLRSILAAEPAPSEVILVSDGEMIDIESDFGDISRVVRIEALEKKGPGHVRNVGAALATGELLCFIDSDISIPQNLFQQIYQTFYGNPHLTAIFGSYDIHPAQPDFLSQYRNLLHHFVHQTSSEKASTFWSGCGIVRREAFLEVGGFDAVKYASPSIEDIELGYRLTRNGHQIKLCKDLQVKHLKKWGLWTMLKVDFSKRALPWTKLILKEKEIINDLNVKWKDRISVVLVFLFLLSCPLVFKNLLFGIIPFLITALFLTVNKKLLRFFYDKKGGYFTLKVIPLQGVFYFICGMAFVIGNIESLLESKNG